MGPRQGFKRPAKCWGDSVEVTGGLLAGEPSSLQLGVHLGGGFCRAGRGQSERCSQPRRRGEALSLLRDPTLPWESCFYVGLAVACWV